MLYIYHPDKTVGEALQLVIRHDDIECYTDKNDFFDKCLENHPACILFFESTPAETAELSMEALRRYPGNDPPKLTVLCFSEQQLFVELIKEHFNAVESFINSGIISLQSLPCHVDALQSVTEKIDDLNGSSDATELLKDFKKCLADNSDRSIRHKMGNAMAACRILHGAVRSGDYDFSKETTCKFLETIYSDLLEIHGIMSEEERNNSIKEFKLWMLDQQQGSFGIIEKTNEWSRKVLVIDDQIDMWQPVWEFIFRNEVDVVATGQEGLNKIADNDYHCVLLDLFLGKEELNGTRILQTIKEKKLDLPVIVMTAYDDPELAQWCIKQGAEAYFVKELEDTFDRYSVDYYQSFLRMLQQVKPFDSPERTSCRKFQEIENALRSYSQDVMITCGILSSSSCLTPTIGRHKSYWPRAINTGRRVFMPIER